MHACARSPRHAIHHQEKTWLPPLRCLQRDTPLTVCTQHVVVRHARWGRAQVGPRDGTGGNVWGVSLVPHGCTEESHPELAAIIRSQHKR
jgi:hypothetical protein